MSTTKTGIYQPRTLQALRKLIASDKRTPAGMGGLMAKRNAYAICGMPGACLVARALEHAKQNEPITDIGVVPSRFKPSFAYVSYVGPDGEYYEEHLNSMLNDVASRFDEEGLKTANCYKSRDDCLALIDAMIAELKQAQEKGEPDA